MRDTGAGSAADVIVVGAGLAGLVAACEVVDRGMRVLILDQENSANLGGQAFWSFGGLFFVDSPEQRRLGIRDSYELALHDWLGSAGFDRADEDHRPPRRGRARAPLGTRPSHERAPHDWLGSAGFARDDEDHCPRRWAEAYVSFAATEKR